MTEMTAARWADITAAFLELPLSVRTRLAATTLENATVEYFKDGRKPPRDALLSSVAPRTVDPGFHRWSAVDLRRVADGYEAAEIREVTIRGLADLLYDDFVDPLDDNNIDRKDCEAVARKLIDLGWKQS